MSFSITAPKNAIDAKRAAIEARKASLAPVGANPAAIVRYILPGECPDRNRIVFDDSGSMGCNIETAKHGVVEYLRNCIPNQTAVAVHFMNTKSWSTDLRSDLLELATDVQEVSIKTGGTPFFNTCKQALEAKPTLTRLIAFTDGSPTDVLKSEDNENALQSNWSSEDEWLSSADIVIKIAKATDNSIPIDTVYFGRDETCTKRAMDLLRYLSAQTGGYFLHFDPAKTNFAQAFKYLAPVNRLMLASASFRASVESGAQK